VVAPSTARRILEALAVHPVKLEASTTTYCIESLFERTEDSGVLTDQEGSRLELALAPMFVHGHKPLRFTGRFVARDAARFVDLLVATLADPTRLSLVEFLHEWHCLPGDPLPWGDVQDAFIARWSRDVLADAARRDHARPANWAVTYVLARVPPGVDGHWPPPAVRGLIEEGVIAPRELATARINARGMTTRDTVAGGFQERVSAAEYRNSAEQLRRRYPKTAQALDHLARYFDRHGRFEDEWTGAIARSEGLTLDEVSTALRALQASDFAIAIHLALAPRRAEPEVIAAHLALGRIAVDAGLARLIAAEVWDPNDQQVNRTRLLDLLRGDIASAIGTQALGETRGVLTGVDALPRLRGHLVGDSKPRVWESDAGSAFGTAVRPLCPAAPWFPKSDPALYEALALFDSLRFAPIRERNLAADELRHLLLGGVAQVAE
jgi:hypothetical protein